MNIKNASVDGHIIDVLSKEDYQKQWRMYVENPSMFANTGMEVSTEKGTYILPFRNKTDNRPGIFPDGCVYYTKLPDENDDHIYNKDNIEMIDFSDAGDVKQFLEKREKIRNIEAISLTEIDDIFIPPIGSDDSPEMVAFKTAIGKKKCDINKYAPRFGENYLNDKRILKGPKITMNKLVDMCKKLDIEAELILRDAHTDVPNPMGAEVSMILTGEVTNNDGNV